jgi:hydantoinase/carbamoylase family amidase
VIGVLAPLEVLRAAQEDGQGPQPLELVIFAEEEGTTFGLGMLGSRTWAGTLAEQDLAAIHNEFGENYLLAGKPYGVLPERFGEERIRPSDYLGLIEIHIEQGPGMWNRNHPVALVTSISGRRQYQVGITGVANHAGSTSMSDRQDALAAAAEMCLAIEKLPAQLGKHVVATVGRLTVSPNAINVIPSEVQLTIDFRAPENGVLAQGDQLLGEVLRQIAARRKVSLQLEPTESLPAVQMSGDVCSLLRQGAQAESVSLLETVSGALHDSAILAPLLPTAMLFVASRDGISHNPAEHSRVEDIALATRILYRAVLASSAS